MTISLEKAMPSPTSSEIAAVESALGLKLPSEYIEFLAIGNGAKPESNLFDTALNGKSSVVEFFPLSRLATEKRWLNNANPSAKLPIAGASGGDWICIETGPVGCGTIWFADHELPDDAAFSRLADSLADFFELLMPWTSNKSTTRQQVATKAWIDPDFLKSLK